MQINGTPVVVCRIAKESRVEAKLGKHWKDAFKRRNNLKILTEKRAITLTKEEAFLRLRRTHTYLQVCGFANMHQSPLSEIELQVQQDVATHQRGTIRFFFPLERSTGKNLNIQDEAYSSSAIIMPDLRQKRKLVQPSLLTWCKKPKDS